jgi:hypothetical protein
MSDWNKDWYREQEEQQRYFDEQDKRDPVQEEIDAEAEKLFGSEVKKGAASLSESSRQILQSYVAAHTALSERQRAYSLAMWILRQAEKRKGG